MIFRRSDSLDKTKKQIASQGNKALISLLRKSRQLQLPYDIQIDLQQTDIAGCEIWEPRCNRKSTIEIS